MAACRESGLDGGRAMAMRMGQCERAGAGRGWAGRWPSNSDADGFIGVELREWASATALGESGRDGGRVTAMRMGKARLTDGGV